MSSPLQQHLRRNATGPTKKWAGEGLTGAADGVILRVDGCLELRTQCHARGGACTPGGPWCWSQFLACTFCIIVLCCRVTSLKRKAFATAAVCRVGRGASLAQPGRASAGTAAGCFGAVPTAGGRGGGRRWGASALWASALSFVHCWRRFCTNSSGGIFGRPSAISVPLRMLLACLFGKAGLGGCFVLSAADSARLKRI
jgi:hypothetical protein